MPGFDEYKKIKTQDQNNNIIQNDQEAQFNNFLQQKRESALPIDHDVSGRVKVKFDYDADQLMEKYESRHADSLSFEEQTRYYFTDTEVARAKVDKYRNLGSAENITLDNFARSYSYNCASKRKQHAITAADEFQLMRGKMQDLNTYGSLMSPVVKFNHKEEIMDHRLKAMLAAAYAKAKSKSHMKFLENRAKLSCYMVLKDQLENAISNLSGDRHSNEITELRSRLKEIQAKIDSAYKGVKKYAPKVQDVWREESGMNDQFYKRKKADYRKQTPILNIKQVKLMSNLEKIQDENAEKEWPFSVILKDRNGAAVNKGEIKAQQKNEQYRDAKNVVANNNDEAQKAKANSEIKKIDMEAIERFNKFKVPSPDDLDNVYDYVMKDPRTYYDIFKKALPYYNRTGVPDHVKNYMKSHSEFMVKVKYLLAVDSYIDYVLRSTFTVKYDKKNDGSLSKPGKFCWENAPGFKYKRNEEGGWTRERAYGAGQERKKLLDLQKSFSRYKSDLETIAYDDFIEDYDLDRGVQRINLDVCSHPDVEKSLDEAYANLENAIKKEKVSEKEKNWFQKVTKSRYLVDSRAIHSIPQSLYLKIQKNPPAGIDVRAIQFLLRPVNLDKYGNPLKKIDAENLRLNIEDVNKLYENKLSARAQFLDRIANEAKEMAYSVDELRDHEFIRKNPERALRHVSFMHNLNNIFKMNAGYYLNKAPKEIRTFMFALNGTDYVNFSTFHIHQAIFGDNGLKIQYSGGSSYTKSYVSLNGKSLAEVKKVNEKISKMPYLNGSNYAMLYDNMYAVRNDQSFMFDDMLEHNATRPMEVSGLDPMAQYLIKKEYGENIKTFTEDMITKLMSKYMTTGNYLILDEGYQDKEKVLLNATEKYPEFKGATHFKNADGVIDDLPKAKVKEKHKDENIINIIAPKEEEKNVIIEEKLSPEEAEYAELKENALPMFDQKSYKLLVKCREAGKILEDKKLKAKDKTADKLNRYSNNTNASVGRAMGPLIKIVKFDKDNNPATKADRENYEWNMKWATAWEEGDYETRDEMIEEEFPKLVEEYTKIKLPPIPENAKMGDTAWIEGYLDELINNDTDFALTVIAQRMIGISNLKTEHASVARYLEANPEIDEFITSISYLGNLLLDYAHYKYGFHADTAKVATLKDTPNGNDPVAVKRSNFDLVAFALNESLKAFKAKYPKSKFLSNEKNFKINKKGFDHKIKVNKDVIKPQGLGRSLTAEYAGMDKYVDTKDLDDKSLADAKAVVREHYLYSKEMTSAIPLSMYEKLKNSKVKGINLNSFLALLRPVRLDKNGVPLNSVEAKWLKNNIAVCEKLIQGKADDKKDFLESVTKSAKAAMFSIEQLEDPEYIRANLPKAIKLISFMNAFKDIFLDNADFFKKKLSPEMKSFAFELVIETDYIGYATQKIQDAIYGHNNIKMTGFDEYGIQKIEPMGKENLISSKKEYSKEDIEKMKQVLIPLQKMSPYEKPPEVMNVVLERLKTYKFKKK